MVPRSDHNSFLSNILSNSRSINFPIIWCCAVSVLTAHQIIMYNIKPNYQLLFTTALSYKQSNRSWPRILRWSLAFHLKKAGPMKSRPTDRFHKSSQIKIKFSLPPLLRVLTSSSQRLPKWMCLEFVYNAVLMRQPILDVCETVQSRHTVAGVPKYVTCFSFEFLREVNVKNIIFCDIMQQISSETSVNIYRTSWRHMPEGNTLLT
jgi:hypothetical protein